MLCVVLALSSLSPLKEKLILCDDVLPPLFVFVFFLHARAHTLSLLSPLLPRSSPSLSFLSPPTFTHLRAVASVLQALVTSVKAMVKKTFSEAQAFEHYGGAGGPFFFSNNISIAGATFSSPLPIIPVLDERHIQPLLLAHTQSTFPILGYDMPGAGRDRERRGGGGDGLGQHTKGNQTQDVRNVVCASAEKRQRKKQNPHPLVRALSANRILVSVSVSCVSIH